MHSMRNLVPFLRIIWNSSRSLSLLSVTLRILRAALPFAMLWVPKLILDQIIRVSRQHGGSLAPIWKLVALEVGLAMVTDVVSRLNALCDSLLGDRFSNRMNLSLMHHASQLDLASFEDPVFYDKLARARDQTGGRLALFSAVLNVFQDIVTLAIFAAGLVVFLPWLVVLLLLSIIPALFGESRLRNLAYSVLYRLTPERRLLDYLRFLGSSAQTIKEVKVFGLGEYLEEIYDDISGQINKENARISVRKTVVGALLSTISIASY